MRIAIIGNGCIANLAALYFRKQFPESTEITMVGPSSRKRLPVVGESTIEITAQFLENKLGLGQYLRKNHYPKYALTYYFKLYPQDQTDRTYSVQCNERDPVDLPALPNWEGPMARPPSWQLNRHTFDRDMRNLVSDTDGIERIHGVVTDINLNGEAGHTAMIKDEDSGTSQIEADWIIDASGRSRVLGRKLGLNKKIDQPRNVFWFRLKDFNRDILKKLQALGPMPPAEGEHYHYDRYFSTHHFMGRGNWIWLIPMRMPDDSELISIGISMHPEIYQHEVRDMEDFMKFVALEHPVVTELVASGDVVDTNIYRNYRYEMKQAYSADRWGLIGDAAASYDPLFSNGLAFSTIQIEQLGAIIEADMNGAHNAEYIGKLDKMFWAPVRKTQATIASWYQEMHDPILSAARLNLIEVSYFYFLLPLVVNRSHYDPDRIDWWNVLLKSEGEVTEVPKMLKALREKIEQVQSEHFVYHGKQKVNTRALEHCGEFRDIKEQMQDGAELLGQYCDELATHLKPN